MNKNQKIESISLSRIVTGNYQRDMSNRRIAQIVKEFDPLKLGVLVVNKRSDGTYAILDGQHRLSAMRTMGCTEANCLIIEDLTVEQEADYFRRQNENLAALNRFDLYRAGICAEDQHYILIKNTLAKHGYQAHKDASPMHVTAIGALTKIVELYGFDILDKTFAYISTAWYSDSVAVRREMLAGIAEFAYHFGNKLTPEQFAARMRDKLPSALYYDYRVRSEGRATFRNAFNPIMRRLFCVVIMEAYNKGLNGQSRNRLKLLEV